MNATRSEVILPDGMIWEVHGYKVKWQSQAQVSYAEYSPWTIPRPIMPVGVTGLADKGLPGKQNEGLTAVLPEDHLSLAADGEEGRPMLAVPAAKGRCGSENVQRLPSISDSLYSNAGYLHKNMKDHYSHLRYPTV